MKQTIHIQYSKPTCATGRQIAEVLGTKRRGVRIPKRKVDILINYGSGENTPETLYDFVLNKPEIVRANANSKGKALITMGKEGVNIPKQYTKEEALASTKFPLLARKNNHRSGSGLKICESKQDVQQAVQRGYTHFMDFLNIKQEFRVHIVGKKVFLVQEKVPSQNGTTNDRIRTSTNGWIPQFRQMGTGKLPKVIFDEARKAVKALGLDFGAADIGLDEKGKAYVFEVNTGAGLTGADHVQRFLRAVNEHLKDLGRNKIFEEPETEG